MHTGCTCDSSPLLESIVVYGAIIPSIGKVSIHAYGV